MCFVIALAIILLCVTNASPLPPPPPPPPSLLTGMIGSMSEMLRKGDDFLVAFESFRVTQSYKLWIKVSKYMINK